MKKKKRRQKKFKYAIISLSILVIFAVVGIFAFLGNDKRKTGRFTEGIYGAY